MSASAHVSVQEDTSPADPMAEREAQVAALTGLRGFAALMVVLVHVSVRTDYQWLGLPAYGPICLFVLSGFLLYRPWARWVLRLGPSPELQPYTWRRVARIFPAYLVVFVAVALIYPPSRPEGVDGWFYNLTLTWIYVPGQFPTVMAQSWSLCTELSWYAALPVMAVVSGAFARRRPPATALRIMTGLMALALPISLGWWIWLHENNLHLALTYRFWLPGYLMCFAGGAIITLYAEAHAAGIVSLARLRRMVSDSWGPVVLILTVLLFSTSTLGGADGFGSGPLSYAEEQIRIGASTVISLVLLLVVVFGRAGSPIGRLMSTRALTASGRWSFSIYLWHLPLLVILDDKMAAPDGSIAELVFKLTWTLGLTIPLSAATYWWIEEPAIRWSRRPRQIRFYRRRKPGRRIVATPRRIASPATTSQPVDASTASQVTWTPEA